MSDNGGRRNGTSLLEEDNGAEWITTYADMVTLLLVFFVMLFAISNLDKERFRAIAAQLKKSFGNPTAIVQLEHPDVSRDEAPETKLPPSDEPEVLRDLDPEILEGLDSDLLREVQNLDNMEQIGDSILVYQEENRITIVVDGQVFFDLGSAELLPGALPVLEQISKVIKDHPKYKVNIKGHTDNNPISTLQFPSNWELSAVRATTVLRYLIAENIDPHRLTATGYGELMPIAPNDTPDNQARNRRVEFVLEKAEKN